MSKKNKDAMDVEEEGEDFNDIMNHKFAYSRYTAAAAVANKVVVEIVKMCQPGKLVSEVTSAADKYVLEQLALAAKKLDHGIAFPVCVSVNNCFGHYSPLNTDKAVLNEGDLAKVDLGVHVDGYVAQVAHTFEVTAQGASAPAITGRKADAIAAAHYAAEAAVRLITPGKKNSDVTAAIAQVAEAFNVKPVEGVLSHQIKRFVIDGNNVINGKSSLDQKTEEFTFEAGQVFAVDIVMSTGEGKGRELETKTTVFKRAVDQTYHLKMQASRTLLNEISKKSPTFPFTLASFAEQSKAKMGITELNNHGMVVPYPVLYEKQGEFVAQIKFVVAIMKSYTNKLTGHALPLVTSEHKITDQALLDLLAQPTGKDNKKPAVAAPTPMEQ